ncbi:MAG: hypothetical protein ACI4OY_02425, partial [Aristaeellaceae bacterium]
MYIAQRHEDIALREGISPGHLFYAILMMGLSSCGRRKEGRGAMYSEFKAQGVVLHHEITGYQ